MATNISEGTIDHAPAGVRLVPRALVAGAFAALAVSTLVGFLAGGFGLRPLGALRVEELGGRLIGFGIVTGLGWIVAASVGGYIAALAAGSARRRDGMLHGFVTWAIACVVGGLLVTAAFLSSIAAGIGTPDAVEAFDRAAVHWGMFLSDAAALVGATLAGALAVRTTTRAPREPVPAGLPAQPRPT